MTELLQLLWLQSQLKPCFAVPVALFSPSCASRFPFSPSRRFPFLFPLEFFLISPPCRVLGSEGLVAVPCDRSWHRVPSGMGLAGLGSRGSLSRAPRSW